MFYHVSKDFLSLHLRALSVSRHGLEMEECHVSKNIELKNSGKNSDFDFSFFVLC